MSAHAGVAQLVEQLICNQQVGGSSPSTSSKLNMEEFPSGQRGQTVNLLRFASVVRIHPRPPSLAARTSAAKPPNFSSQSLGTAIFAFVE